MRSHGHCRRPRCLRKGCACRCGACGKAKERESGYSGAGDEVHTLVAKLKGPSGRVYEATYEVLVPERGVEFLGVTSKVQACGCGKPVDPEYKAFCRECYTEMKARYRKEIIGIYGHEVLSKEAHLLELQEQVAKFLEEARGEFPDKRAEWEAQLARLTRALGDSKKTRPRKS